ncbi:transcription factor HES-1 isoform 2-T2 [Liasis olivaceus]
MPADLMEKSSSSPAAATPASAHPTPDKPRTAAEQRKSSKPIMEKRRRARINESLGQLKTLILDALKKDSSRHSKLEKADILEMTVKHLRSLQRAQMTAALNTDPTVLCKYRAGFNECMNEVTRFLSTCEGVNTEPLRPTAVRSSRSTPTGDWAQAFPLPLPPSPQDPVPHRSQQTRSGDPGKHSGPRLPPGLSEQALRWPSHDCLRVGPQLAWLLFCRLGGTLVLLLVNRIFCSSWILPSLRLPQAPPGLPFLSFGRLLHGCGGGGFQVYFPSSSFYLPFFFFF